VKKIISLFARNYEGDGLVRDEVVAGAEWVLAGEGVPTRKWDGTCCMVKNHRLYKRYDAKHGKTPPPGFIPAQDPDPKTGHWPGWLLVRDIPEDRWFNDALDHVENKSRHLIDNARWPVMAEGTYELCGPKINANRERLDAHLFLRHGEAVLPDCARTFDGIREFLRPLDIEGIVWHRGNGDMVKIKRSDFGFKRG